MRGDTDRAIAGFRRGDQARSEERGRVQQPRLRLPQQRRDRPRHRRFQRGDQAQRRTMRPRFTTAPPSITTSTTSTARSRISTRRIKLDANYRGRLQRARRRPRQQERIRPGDRRISARPSSSIRKNARAFNNRGFAYRNRGDFDRAIADYSQALALNPSYALALYNRGIAYYDKRDVEHATRDMNQAIKLNPNFSTAVHDRGIANYDNHDYDRTIAAADAADQGEAELMRRASAARQRLRKPARGRPHHPGRQSSRSATTSTTPMPIRRIRSRRPGPPQSAPEPVAVPARGAVVPPRRTSGPRSCCSDAMRLAAGTAAKPARAKTVRRKPRSQRAAQAVAALADKRQPSFQR